MLLKQVDVMGIRIVNELFKITASAEVLFIVVATTCDVKQLVADRAQVPMVCMFAIVSMAFVRDAVVNRSMGRVVYCLLVPKKCHGRAQSCRC